MYDRMTDRSRKVLQLAQRSSAELQQEYVGTECILLGLINEGSGVGANVLKNLFENTLKSNWMHHIKSEILRLCNPGSTPVMFVGNIPLAPRAKKVIEYGFEEARLLNHNYFGTEHLLLGLIREHDGVAAQVLMNAGITLGQVREETMRLLGAEEPESDKYLFDDFGIMTNYGKEIDKKITEAIKPILAEYLLEISDRDLRLLAMVVYDSLRADLSIEGLKRSNQRMNKGKTNK